MHGQVLLGDVTGDGHCVEDVHEHVVYLVVEALQYLVAERKSLSHVSRFVVASEQDHVLGEVKFDREEQHAHFDSKNSTVNVVSKEEIVEASRLPSF